MIMSVPGVYAQSSSDYLETLEGEASNLELDKRTKSTGTASSIAAPSSSSFNPEQGGAITDLGPGLSVEQFEQILQRNYIGSYLFYKRLNDQHKQEVYAFYQSNPDPAKVRDKILQVSKR
ncbi:MAG: hypothetical protein QNJ69_03345 [Gammaproteobacteria bacterium]|nr:hypothetical protein [Gammaproteobacteria bacterium]